MTPKAYPFFGVVVAFAAGISFAFSISVPTYTLLISLGILCLCAVGYLRFAPKPWFRQYAWGQSLWVFSLFMLLGMYRMEQAHPGQTPDHMIHWADTLEVSYYEARFLSNIERTTKSQRATLEILKIQVDSISVWARASGKLIAYFPLHDSTLTFQYGDKILVKGKPYPVPSPSNPHAFDYRAYLETQGITHQHFLRRGSFLQTDSVEGFTIMSASWNTRQWLAQQFHEFIPQTQSRAIALALVLGVKNELDNTLRDAYAGAGAMHVLAVSGLHVGIIVLILNILFRPLAGYKWGILLKGILSLLLLWAYAFITGLSPSVMRAVTMFSVVIVGQLVQREGNIYNTLSFSALVLLLYNPYMLYQVGFQLSFAAVVGIVWLYPFIYSWFSFKWKLADWAWQLTCVSLAAQAATFPIGLLYFHQFPNYFFLSNLVVIPGAFAVVSGGLSLLILSPISTVASSLGWIVGHLIQGMNFLIQLLNELPFAVTDNVYIDVFSAICLSLIVIFTGKLWVTKNIQWQYALLGVALCFSGWEIARTIQNQSTKTIGVYQTSRKANLALLRADKPVILVDSTLLNDENTLGFTFNEDLLFKGISPENLFFQKEYPPAYIAHAHPFPQVTLLTWEGKLILWLHGKTRRTFPIAVDYVIISNNAIYNLTELGNIHCKMIILDNTIGYRTGENLTQQAIQQGVPIHWVAKQGAWQAAIY